MENQEGSIVLRFLSLKQKLLISYALLIVLCGGVLLNVILDLGKVSGLVDEMYTKALEPAVWISAAGIEAVYQNRDLYDNLCETDPKEREKIAASMSRHHDAMEKKLQLFSETHLSPKEKTLLDQFHHHWVDYRKLAEEGRRLSEQGDVPGAMKIVSGPAAAKFEEAEHALLSLVRLNEELAKEERESSHSVYSHAVQIAELGGIFVIILVVAIGTILATTISRKIMSITEKLSTGAQTVATASAQISSASSELSAAAAEQAASLQESVASVDEINAMVVKNTENSQKSQQVSDSSKESAERGKMAVDDMINSIREISESNDLIMKQIAAGNREISEIVNVINEIGNQTKVINDIVFQTKLLSFNASIEAARAGEYGKGFAVVAEEVGSLAQMSGNAANEISAKLESSIQKVQRIVDETQRRVHELVEAGQGKIGAGIQTAQRCGETLDEVLGYVTDVNSMVGEIATASEEQSEGIREITKAMGQLDLVTQQNASAAEESASASESLTHQAAHLRSIVVELAETVNGAGTSAPAGNHSRFQEPKQPNLKNVA